MTTTKTKPVQSATDRDPVAEAVRILHTESEQTDTRPHGVVLGMGGHLSDDQAQGSNWQASHRRLLGIVRHGSYRLRSCDLNASVRPQNRTCSTKYGF